MAERAAIFTRINHSDAKRYGDVTTNRQLAACATYCVDRGYTVEDAHIYTEVSQARAGAHRPVFDALRAAMRSGAFDVVVALNHTRLTLTMYADIEFNLEALEHGVRVEYVEPITDVEWHPRTREDWELLRRVYREELSQRAKRGAATRRARRHGQDDHPEAGR
jgi:hypothetical protein